MPKSLRKAEIIKLIEDYEEEMGEEALREKEEEEEEEEGPSIPSLPALAPIPLPAPTLPPPPPKPVPKPVPPKPSAVAVPPLPKSKAVAKAIPLERLIQIQASNIVPVNPQATFQGRYLAPEPMTYMKVASLEPSVQKKK